MQPLSTAELVVSLRRAAQELTEQHTIRDLNQTLRQIVTLAVQTIPGIDAGNISLVQGGQVETREPTSEVIGKLDMAQNELFEGPSIRAIEDRPVSV